MLARVGAVAQSLVDHLLAQVGGALAERGYAIDHVDDEVEAVEVVEHHHVERRRRRALLLVAAYVDVGVVGAPVGEPVDQPRIAVVGEDDGPARGEQRVELASGRPCGCSLSGCSRIRSTTLTTRTFSSGSRRRRIAAAASGLERGDVAAARQHDVGLVLAVAEHAQSQIPSPRVQCATASSIVR